MSRRNLNWYLLKIERISGWLLAPLILLYLCTGYATAGRYGFERLLDGDAAYAVHQFMDRPLLVLFLAHLLTAGYFSFRRWGWLGRRNKWTGRQ